jgi:hypothetical protein
MIAICIHRGGGGGGGQVHKRTLLRTQLCVMKCVPDKVLRYYFN